MKNRFFFIVANILVLLLSSCNVKKKITYYQNIDQSNILQKETTFETKIQPDDLLSIFVSSVDMEAAGSFNLETVVIPSPNGQSALAQRQQQFYLVDNEGNINFPILGTLKIGGLTKAQMLDLIISKLKKYLKDPVVNIRIVNFKVSVQGEVLRPGVITSSSERLTLPEALSLAGDLTIYGRRDNVLIVRELNGKKEYQRVDLTKSDFINSPYYYLSQNDLIYIEPNTAKSNSSTFNQNTAVWISLSSVLVSLILLLRN